VKTGTSVLEKEAKPPIPDSNAELTLPITTGLRIGQISEEKGVRAVGGVLLRPKVVCNLILHIQITLGILDLRQLERLSLERGLVKMGKRSAGGRRTGWSQRGRRDGGGRNRRGHDGRRQSSSGSRPTG
jgi:hypothetical protein